MTRESDDFRDAAEQERLVRAVRSLRDEPVELLDPPPDLWARIRAEVDDGRPDVDAGAPTAAPSIEVISTAAESPAPPVVVPMRRRPQMLLAAAAVVALLAGVAGVVLAIRNDAPSTVVVATADLDQLEPLGSAAASARLVERDGVTHLVIDTSDMPPAPDGSEYELWLIDRGATDPRSLGVVTGSADVVVPTTIDPTDHPLVDISLEPVDGDDAHSGHSLMRGELA